MKKVKVLATALLIVMCFSVFAFAASAGGSVQGSTKEGQTFSVVFTVSSDAVSSGSIALSYSSNLEFVKGEWLVKGTSMANYNASNKNGVFGFASATKLSGNYFKATFKAKTVGSASVSANIELKNGAKVVGTLSKSFNINVECDHSFGAYTTTKEATCTQAGSKERTCSKCSKVEQVSIPALGHKLKDATITKEASCTAHGEQSGVCERCGQSAKVSTPLAPHTYGEWTITKKASCTQAGEKTSTCSVCDHKTTEAAVALGHDFVKGAVIQEASISSEGLCEASCSRCGATGTIKSPCSSHDEATGIYFETEEGVFPEGTSIIAENCEISDAVKEALKEISSKLVVFDISADNAGSPVQPNGSVAVTIPMPESFGRNVAAYYIAEDGSKEELPVVIDMVNKTVSVELSHFSTYVLADLSKDAGSDPSAQGGLGALSYALIAVAAVEAIVIVVLLGKKKKA